ncbi:MAG TPA: pantetheine-phosphate adenylyltransferase [Fimbriimonadales bacterium]|nr:pantetheine-phosphate adenylyltransferase [Fimbriimonadales bacterium]
MAIAVYPGSFDPPTFGHLDIVQRASALFEKLYIAIGRNPSKEDVFTLEERVKLMEALTRNESNIQVEAFEGLLVNFVKEKGAKVIVRGLRAVSDFENEFQMALMNRQLAGIETVFLMTSAEYLFVSSSIVEEVASFGGDVSKLVPDIVAARLKEKFKKQ